MCKNIVFCIALLLITGCSALNFGSSSLNTAIADNNRGCDYEDQGNYAKAVEYYQKSADAGLLTGKANLGRCYYFGLGVPKNPSYAVSLLIQPAQSGFANSQLILGQAMYFGIGTRQDVQNGYALIQAAASKGDPQARDLLHKIDQAQLQYKLQRWHNLGNQYRLQLQHDAARYAIPQITRQRVSPKNTPKTPNPKPAPLEDAPDKLD